MRRNSITAQQVVDAVEADLIDRPDMLRYLRSHRGVYEKYAASQLSRPVTTSKTKELEDGELALSRNGAVIIRAAYTGGFKGPWWVSLWETLCKAVKDHIPLASARYYRQKNTVIFSSFSLPNSGLPTTLYAVECTETKIRVLGEKDTEIRLSSELVRALTGPGMPFTLGSSEAWTVEEAKHDGTLADPDWDVPAYCRSVAILLNHWLSLSPIPLQVEAIRETDPPMGAFAKIPEITKEGWRYPIVPAGRVRVYSPPDERHWVEPDTTLLDLVKLLQKDSNPAAQSKIYLASTFTDTLISLSDVTPTADAKKWIESYLAVVYPQHKAKVKVDTTSKVNVSLSTKSQRIYETGYLPDSPFSPYLALSAGASNKPFLVKDVKIPPWAVKEHTPGSFSVSESMRFFLGPAAQNRRPSEEVKNVRKAQQGRNLPIYLIGGPAGWGYLYVMSVPGVSTPYKISLVKNTKGYLVMQPDVTLANDPHRLTLLYRAAKALRAWVTEDLNLTLAGDGSQIKEGLAYRATWGNRQGLEQEVNSISIYPSAEFRGRYVSAYFDKEGHLFMPPYAGMDGFDLALTINEKAEKSRSGRAEIRVNKDDVAGSFVPVTEADARKFIASREAEWQASQ